ncbi:MAG: gamma-glutamyltransferase family protein [Anaerolineales bacterium]
MAGRIALHARFGTQPLTELVAPALALAEEGFEVDDHYVTAARETLEVYNRYPALRESCAYVFRTHLRSGSLRHNGEVLRQPALARLLREIATSGGESFVHGAIAKALNHTMRAAGGILRAADVDGYRPQSRTPIRAHFYEYELIAMGSPSSGGIALAETLNILEAVDFKRIAQSDAGLAVHYEIEAMKHAFADRSRYGGDADFVDVPTALLTSKAYAAKLAARISATATLSLSSYGVTSLPDDAGTSHFSIVDSRGMVVASTETINTAFGSLAAVDEWGLILNNEMDDFAAEPGKPNAFGLVQSDRNAVAPGKRPLSSMSPTIVLKEGRPFLVLGASGGPRIISSVLHVLLEVTVLGHTLEQAMTARRPHHQWKPDRVFFDEAPSAELAHRLKQLGHKIASKRKTGIVQAVLRTSHGWTGGSDPRKGGRPAGN